MSYTSKILIIGLCILFGNSDVLLAADRIEGLSTTFMKKRELMQGDHWKNKPLPIAKAVRNLSRYDAIWCSQLIPWYNKDVWFHLRRNDHEIVMLRTFSGNNTNPKGNNAQAYNYINDNHPEWFLLKNTKDPAAADPRDPDNRIRWDPVNENHIYYNRFFFDVGNKDLQLWIADYILQWIVSGSEDSAVFPYDGIGMDNVLLDIWARKITKRHPYWKYADKPAQWVQAYLDYIQTVRAALKAAGFVLVVNHTLDYSSQNNLNWWQALENRADGLMDENAMDGSYFYDQRWLSSMTHHERIQQKGLIDWWLVYPSERGPRAYEDFLFGYCSWRLAKNSDRSFFFSSRGVLGYKNPKVPDYKEYTLDLGRPHGNRYPMGDCWARNYTNAALVVVNPTRKKKVISLPRTGSYLDYHANRNVENAFQMPAQSGRIFLRTDTD